MVVVDYIDYRDFYTCCNTFGHILQRHGDKYQAELSQKYMHTIAHI
jgi:hypothetical protein